MANRIEVTTLLDGDRHLVIHTYLKSDGATGDINSYELLDPADYDFLPGSEKKFVLEDVSYGFCGFSANLHFELLLEDKLIWVLPPSASGYVDFKKYGGLKDRGNPLDATGKLLLSTTGLVDDGDEGSMIIKVRKT